MKNWKSMLGTIAPGLATAVGGPFAGMATKLISDKLLGKPDGDDSEIYEALTNPDGLHKLKEAEYEFKIKLKELDLKESDLVIKDRDSARNMASKTSIWPQVILSAITTAGFFAAFYLMMRIPNDVTTEASMIIGGMFGALMTNMGMVMKFWFGGSPSDDANNERIYNSVPKEKL